MPSNANPRAHRTAHRIIEIHALHTHTHTKQYPAAYAALPAVHTTVPVSLYTLLPILSLQWRQTIIFLLGARHSRCPPTYHLPAEIVSCIMDTDVEGQPSNGTKRSLPANTAILPYDAEQRNAHILRYITRSASDSTMDADVHVPAV